MPLELDANEYIESVRATIEGGGEFDGALTLTAAAVSIATSLKRIADALTYQATGNENLFDQVRKIADKGPF